MGKAQKKISDEEKNAQRWSQDGKTAKERLGYKYDPKEGVDCSDDPVLTEQHHEEELDINKIIQRYSLEGAMAASQSVQAAYGDFSQVDDLHAMMNKVRRAEEAFSALPHQIKTRFNNNPAELLDAIKGSEQDQKLAAELQELGVLEKPAPTPAPVPVPEPKKD